MSIVCAFLVPGSPLPRLVPDNPPWAALREGCETAGRRLAEARPDVIAVYSTQWIAVLDQLWQTRPRSTGVHVDENWHEYGELPFDITADTDLAAAVIAATPRIGVRSKGVDYEGFPIDTGTIVAKDFLNADGALPMLIGSNNVYHDWDTTRALAATVAECAEALGRRVALVGVGGLSGTIFREEIDIAGDRIASEEDDAWNRRVLGLMEQGEYAALQELCPEYAQAARVDMGFKHLAWMLGALGEGIGPATVHAYGPTWGAGAAVVEFGC